MRLLGLTVCALLFYGCSPPMAGTDLSIPYTHTWSGSANSTWFTLKQDSYQVDTRMAPAGCASHIVLAGRNEYPVVSLWPEFVAHVPNPAPPPSSQWTGWSARLVDGSYRFEGRAPAGCQWSIRISRDLSNASAQAGTCGQVASLTTGSFVRITGDRVTLPANSALAQSSQRVQPQNVPISAFGIGIDDGTGVCAVLWITGPDVPPVPRMGEHVTFIGQVIRDNGKPYLGITLHP